MKYALTDTNESVREDSLLTRALFGVLTLAQLSYFVYFEIIQACAESKWYQHYDNFWNINDALWLSFGPIVVVASIPTTFLIDPHSLVIMTTLTSFSMMIKAMDWMRLFYKTAFYILLIQETIVDISYFLLLLVMTLLVFGFPMIMLNMNR